MINSTDRDYENWKMGLEGFMRDNNILDEDFLMRGRIESLRKDPIVLNVKKVRDGRFYNIRVRGRMKIENVRALLDEYHFPQEKHSDDRGEWISFTLRTSKNEYKLMFDSNYYAKDHLLR